MPKPTPVPRVEVTVDCEELTAEILGGKPIMKSFTKEQMVTIIQRNMVKPSVGKYPPDLH